jgi:hypothetical protein
MLVHKSEKEIYISNNYKAKGNEKQNKEIYVSVSGD